MVQSGERSLFLDQRGRPARAVLRRSGERVLVRYQAEIAVFLAALSGLFAGGVGGEETGYRLGAVQRRTAGAAAARLRAVRIS